MYGIWTLFPPIFAMLIALLSKNVLLALFAGMCSISVMTSGLNFLAPLGEFMIQGITGNGEVLMSFIPIGMMLWFMQKGGGFRAFSKWANKKINSPTKVKGMTFLLTLILSVNDYLADLTVGQIMKPVALQNRVARHKIGFIVSNTANITSLLPFSAYFLFSSGMVASILPGTNGLTFYYKSIWFSFFTMISILTAVLFATGVIPDIGSMKKHQRAMDELSDEQIAAQISADSANDEDGEVADFKAFALPLIALIVTLAVSSILGKGIVLLPALWVGCIVSIVYPLITKTMKFSEVSGGCIAGFMNQAPIFLILIFAFGFGSMLGSIGFSDYIVTLFGGTVAKAVVPLLIFIVASLVSYSTGSLGTALVMMLPIALPLASATGASLALTFGACYSGSQIGDHTSPISDVIIMISGSNELDPVETSKSFMPYRLIQFGICAVLFLVCGIIM